MSHFIAFYKCSKCGEPIAGLVSDTILIVCDSEKNGGCYLVVNPHKIKVGTLEVFCSRCASSGTFKIESECYICHNKVELFYYPSEVMVTNPDGEKILAMTESLLTQYNLISLCSVSCWRKRMRDETAEPIFLEFQRD